MPTRDKSLLKTFSKNYCIQAGSNFQTYSTQRERNLNGRRESMSIFPDDLEQVHDNVKKRKLHQTGLEEVTLKLIKDWLEQCKEVFQSFCVTSGVAFSGNNDFWKSYCWGWDKYGGSCLMNTSLTSIFCICENWLIFRKWFLHYLSWHISAVTNSFREWKWAFESLKDNFLWNDRRGYNIMTFWFDQICYEKYVQSKGGNH